MATIGGMVGKKQIGNLGMFGHPLTKEEFMREK
jgi:hypothetical protein